MSKPNPGATAPDVTPDRPRWGRVALLALLILFVFLAWPRRWFNDDCFITYRYARHIAEGHGYVWNIVDGERVEGSTSLAWTLLNAGAIRLGLDPVPFSQVLGLGSGLLGLALLYAASRRYLRLPPRWALLAPALLVGHRQWVLWAVAAQEMLTASVIAFAATLRFADEAEFDTALPLSGLLFFLATLFRPEVPLLHLAAGIGLFASTRGANRGRPVVRSGIAHAVPLLALIAFRLAYFGQAMPNTFYAKVGGVQLETGLRYLLELPLQTSGWLWGPLLLGLLYVRPARSPLIGALAIQTMAWCCWIAVEGGGRWELRFFVPLLPALALLIVEGTVTLNGLARSALRPRAAWALTAVTIAGLLMAHTATLRRPFRTTPLLASAEHLEAVSAYILAGGRLLANWIGPNDRIATGWAGGIPYATDAWHLDTWGLNDREIARRPFDPDAVLYHQRHATWSDIVDREVMFVDIYNKFLFPSCLKPADLRAEPSPWVVPGVPVYCVPLPQPARERYWIFASARPQAEVEDWLHTRGLEAEWVLPFREAEP